MGWLAPIADFQRETRMAFLKLRCERAYDTGAIRTNLSPRDLAVKLTHAGMPSAYDGKSLTVRCKGDVWHFGDWEHDGMSLVGWLRFTTEGSIAMLSDALSRQRVRHIFDHSRPFDLITDDVRSVTQYCFGWSDAMKAGAAFGRASIISYDEVLATGEKKLLV